MEKIVDHNANLFNEYYNTINEIEKLQNNTIIDDKKVYTFKGKQDLLQEVKESHITDLGICDRKRLKRFLNKCRFVNSLGSINRLFHFVAKEILKSDERVKLVSEQHERIQKLRKEWLKLKDAADLALQDYKDEKGTFYKNIKGL